MPPKTVVLGELINRVYRLKSDIAENEEALRILQNDYPSRARATQIVSDDKNRLERVLKGYLDLGVTYDTENLPK